MSEIKVINNTKNGLGLPKWPQCLITGKPVTLEQAKEIIRRTDTFFSAGYGGNAHDLNRKIRKMVGHPPDIWDLRKDGKDPDWAAYWAEETAWREKWGTVYTEYLRNTWISSSYVGGPYGWCHPDGQIGFVDNIGKWPSVERVTEDLQVLLTEFPFLELGITLMSGEYCDETSPVVCIRAKEGVIELFDPGEVNVHEGHPEATRRPGVMAGEFIDFRLPAEVREFGIPWHWIEEWARTHGPMAKVKVTE